jgi:hypothetical protein
VPRLWQIMVSVSESCCVPHPFRIAALGSSLFLHKSSDSLVVTDVLGRHVTLSKDLSIAFFYNIGNMHWNLLHVTLQPHPELQVYEPMGMQTRSKVNAEEPISKRYLPTSVLQWLDHVHPMKGTTWLSLAKSAITMRHQQTGFDCGVACLLYAEKIGQKYLREDINEFTTQDDISKYRTLIQSVFMVNQIPDV